MCTIEMKLKKKKFNSIRLYYIIILYNISRISFIFFLREIFFNSIIDNNFSLSLFQFSIDLRNSFLCYEWIKFIFSNVPTCLLQRVLKKSLSTCHYWFHFFPSANLESNKFDFLQIERSRSVSSITKGGIKNGIRMSNKRSNILYIVCFRFRLLAAVLTELRIRGNATIQGQSREEIVLG